MCSPLPSGYEVLLIDCVWQTACRHGQGVSDGDDIRAPQNLIGPVKACAGG